MFMNHVSLCSAFESTNRDKESEKRHVIAAENTVCMTTFFGLGFFT